MKQSAIVLCTILVCASPAQSQFLEDFAGDSISFDPSGVNGWAFFTGDGSAIMNFSATREGYASITVDATKDTRNIWWALIRRRVSDRMDLNLLGNPEYALRIEARIRTSDAPRRVNLHLNTQRTTDFHTHLMEFDIPDTTQWHTISMTTHDFDALPGDSVYGQLALMDWGFAQYRVELDYFRVDIVNVSTAGPDKGVQVAYRPPVPEPATFSHHVPVAQDCTIDSQYPDMNFNSWRSRDKVGKQILLSVSSTQYAILRWELSAFAGQIVVGSGLLELTTHALQRSPEYAKDFGMVRISEIIGGDPHWTQENVTYNSLCGGVSLKRVLNPQMIIDIDVTEGRGGQTLATISNPVLQRLIDGRTFGLAIGPLGAVSASFYAMENQGGKLSAVLHFCPASDSSKRKQ